MICLQDITVPIVSVQLTGWTSKNPPPTQLKSAENKADNSFLSNWSTTHPAPPSNWCPSLNIEIHNGVPKSLAICTRRMRCNQNETHHYKAAHFEWCKWKEQILPHQHEWIKSRTVQSENTKSRGSEETYTNRAKNEAMLESSKNKGTRLVWM